MRKLCAPAFFHSILFLVIIFALALLARAQNGAGTGAAQAAPRAYDVSKEVTLRGTISAVVARPAPGLPLGMHLLVATPQGTVDVHVGQFLAPSAVDNGLVPGAAIQITGVLMGFDAGDVFLAHILVVRNQIITVRNEHGILVRPPPPAARTARSPQPAGGR